METKQTEMNMQNEKEKENAQNTSAKQENKEAIKKYSPMQLIVYSAKKSFESVKSEVDFNREANFALQILESNNYLQKARPESIRNAIVNLSLTGLTLNPALKYAYLVPRNSQDGLNIVLDISYIGMIKLLTDAGAVKNVDAGVIYSNDKYDFRKGSDPYFKHQPALVNRGEKVGAYAIAYFRDGGFQFEIMGKEEIEKVRATSESYKNEKTRKYSPWENWEDEMWKKTVLKRLFKLLPKTKFSEQLIAAISSDHDNEINDLPKEQKYANFFDEEIQEAQEVKSND